MGCGAQQQAPTETTEETEAPEEAEEPTTVETVRIGAILPLTGGLLQQGLS